MKKDAEKTKPNKAKLKRRKVKTSTKLICVGIITVAVALTICIVIPIYNKYEIKQKERAELEQQEKALILERSKLRRIEQYIGTDEYKELYTRYILGYTKPGDEVVDAGD